MGGLEQLRHRSTLVELHRFKWIDDKMVREVWCGYAVSFVDERFEKLSWMVTECRFLISSSFSRRRSKGFGRPRPEH